ncbi:two-component sensor histidine kinase [Dactylosporangium aurantiacum]|uniref:histidine kinase n=1 Tax=Dactylosporangium aurantiacum TaxID=35754 RepID=A0A9Q9MII0_9ACTN|nr:histidine kinase [Dactylosporangium aurantiacum]MDG6106830.1 histidine kinase [Dactylosporangium aurantiacum]UWZ50967.1 two-component sensor histidine kinase [Dactylosporangium aurantiacum]
MTSTIALLSAVTRRRFLVSAWPWRGLAYTAGTAVASAVLWLLLCVPAAPVAAAVWLLGRLDGGSVRSAGTTLCAAAALALTGVGLLAAAGPKLALAVARIERWRLRLAGDGPAPSRPGGSLYGDPATWRAVAYLPLLAVVAPVWAGALGLVALIVVSTPLSVHYHLSGMHSPATAAGRAALGAVLVPVLLYLAAACGGAHAALARLLLCAEPDPAAAELVEVARSRARLADAFDAERRRIERDLHDVAQQRLVSLTMQLGLARLDLPADSPAAAAVAAAHEQAKTLMVELRDLVRGISPRTLRELGLRAAVEELAAAGPLPVRVEADPGRFAPAVETVAYAAVSEALANAVKHAAATEAVVTARRHGDALTVEVRDDGRGGADPARGSGITGLADRAAAAGGRLLMSSPAGGPTILRVELPCGS